MSMLLRNKITLLVCDMAGTVINEQGIIYKSIGNTLHGMGFKTTEEDRKIWHGRDKREVLLGVIERHYKPRDRPWMPKSTILEKVREAEKKLLKELEKNYFENEKIKLIDEELLNMFDSLRINGVKIALNTGYPKKFQKKIIDHFNLEDRIDAYISSEEVKFGRPAPYMIHRLMEECDIPSVKNVAKIGDTINDMKEGRNAGCGLTIGVLTGADKKKDLLKHGDIVINKITDLKDDEVPIFLL